MIYDCSRCYLTYTICIFISANLTANPAIVTNYRAGFNECLGEINKFFSSAQDMDPNLKVNILNHLSNTLHNSVPSLPPGGATQHIVKITDQHQLSYQNQPVAIQQFQMSIPTVSVGNYIPVQQVGSQLSVPLATVSLPTESDVRDSQHTMKIYGNGKVLPNTGEIMLVLPGPLNNANNQIPVIPLYSKHLPSNMGSFTCTDIDTQVQETPPPLCSDPKPLVNNTETDRKGEEGVSNNTSQRCENMNKSQAVSHINSASDFTQTLNTDVDTSIVNATIFKRVDVLQVPNKKENIPFEYKGRPNVAHVIGEQQCRLQICQSMVRDAPHKPRQLEQPDIHQSMVRDAPHKPGQLEQPDIHQCMVSDPHRPREIQRQHQSIVHEELHKLEDTQQQHVDSCKVSEPHKSRDIEKQYIHQPLVWKEMHTPNNILKQHIFPSMVCEEPHKAREIEKQHIYLPIVCDEPHKSKEIENHLAQQPPPIPPPPITDNMWRPW